MALLSGETEVNLTPLHIHPPFPCLFPDLFSGLVPTLDILMFIFTLCFYFPWKSLMWKCSVILKDLPLERVKRVYIYLPNALLFVVFCQGTKEMNK